MAALLAVIAVAALAGGGGVLATSPTSVVGTAPLRVKTELPATATNLTEPSNNSPTIVADPTNDRFVVLANRLDAPEFGCALQVSGDGGRGWIPADPVPKLPPGADRCYAPEVAFDRQGALYYLFVGLAGAGNEPMGVFLTTSEDRAQTFSPPREVLGARNFAVRMAIDPTVGKRGRVHLVWLHATSDPPLGGFVAEPNPILAAHSDDGGRTFSSPVTVSDLERQRVVAPALALGPDGRVHVAYYDLQGDARDYQGLEGPTWEGHWSVVLATSTDGGRRFGSGVVVDDAIVASERVMLIFTMPPPSLAVDGDRLCVAWTDARHGDPDVLSRCSATGGRTWGRLRRVNDDGVGNGLRQYLPRVSFSPDGRLDAVFLDRREDPQNARNNVFYTYSADGGATFARNHKLTSTPSPALVGQQYVGPAAEGQYEWGSRLALLSRRKSVLAAWPDTRNSGPGTAQDVLTTEVVVPSRTSRAPDRTAVGTGLLAAGGLALAGAAWAWRRRPAGSER